MPFTPDPPQEELSNTEDPWDLFNFEEDIWPSVELPPPPEEVFAMEFCYDRHIRPYIVLISMWSLLDPSHFYAYHFEVLQLSNIKKNLLKFFAAIEMILNVSFPKEELFTATTEDQISRLMQEISVEQAVNTDEVTQERRAQYNLINKFSYFESRPQDLRDYFRLDEVKQLYTNLKHIIKMVNCVSLATQLRKRLFVTTLYASYPAFQLGYSCHLCRRTITQDQWKTAQTDLCRDCCSST